MHISSELVLIIIASVVVVSYLFSIASNYIKIPSVLLLLATGIIVRVIAVQQHWALPLPEQLTEMLGAVGLIMIVLEAGLDLKLGREKIPLIRNSFLAALFIFILSLAGIGAALYYVLHEPLLNCIVYAIPLSIMSSSIVIPSLHQLTQAKKEFLIYEASFSDIIGILVFNYFIGEKILTLISVGAFFLNIIISVMLSLLFSVLLFLILTKAKTTVKFFLIFALLIILYEGGKMMGLPSLIIILVFGLLMNNWHLVNIPRIANMFPKEKVEETTHLLHSLTAESSFLIRTFFFILFGFSIDLNLIASSEVIMIGSGIVVVLLITRFFYLRFFLRESVYPEVVFIPRGLITILLFYKIPATLELKNFNDGILFFVILVTSLIMMMGMFFYKKRDKDIVSDELLIN
ncbi:sodium:proton exchanger [Panacibacter ginsenosidivorans]|uniref:Sodium:proton exchanger n=1 Tax=Panacibacter ginsenosidivorans TaxID=1813871 RepID=A0A5B8V418_9BACT|nr:cation:proton antiporter [Panacibacter ginsenosidivorans]QEC66267.1 sodium:proton exchanger [Panacibacter ginsenosidivorans]